MSQYKCTHTFTSKSEKRYVYGEKIGASEYNSLDYSEKRYFKQDDDDDPPPGFDSPPSVAMGDIFGTGMPGGLDGDMTTII